MTVTANTNRTVYAGNGSTTAFSTVFKFFENEEVLVTLVSNDGIEAVQAITTNYTISGAGGVGTITMIVPPASGESLIVTRDMEFTQTHDYVENDPFPADAHEVALDKLTMQDQQLKEELDRSIKSPIGVVTPYNLPVAEAGKVIGWNGTEDDLVNLVVDPGDAIGAAQYEEVFIATSAQAAGTTPFTLTIVPANDNNLAVYIQGVKQARTEFSYLNGVVTFLGSYPDEGDSVFFITGQIIGTLGIPASVQNIIDRVLYGTGSPEGVVVASVGVMFLRDDGGVGTTLYIKESGSSNTGWVGK